MPDGNFSAGAAPLDVLRQVFGFPAFRGLQQEVVEHIVGGGDALVLMPTGGGKSLCYQVPALCRPGTAEHVACVVQVPVIAIPITSFDLVSAISGLKGRFRRGP